MKKSSVEYTKGEMGDVRIVKDFLPPPSQLVLRDDNVKVTLSLSRRSINFFKREAKKQRVPYQKMIRALVDRYAERLEK
jgi:predicted DNA binding CopG/RHH family protein